MKTTDAPEFHQILDALDILDEEIDGLFKKMRRKDEEREVLMVRMREIVLPDEIQATKKKL